MNKAKEALDYYSQGILTEEYRQGLDDGDKSAFWDEMCDWHGETIRKALELLDKVQRGGDFVIAMCEVCKVFDDTISNNQACDLIIKEITDKYILIERE